MRRNKPEGVSVYRKRITIVYFFVLLLGFACIAKILYLVIAKHNLYSGTSKECLDQTKAGWENDPLAQDSTCQCFLCENTLRPVRGEIFDDKGRLLVGNYNVFEIAIEGNHLSDFMIDTLKKNPQLADQLIENLSTDFYKRFNSRFPNRTKNSYRQLFTKALKEQHYVTILPARISNEKTWITGNDTAFIKHLPCLFYLEKEGGRQRKFDLRWNFVPANVRINPYGEMAKRTLGMNNAERQYGLEYIMDEVLAGTEGSKKYLEINHAKVPLQGRLNPTDGKNIHTTLDLEIQNIVHNELSHKLIELNAQWGSAIVMEVATGEIKAISNLRRAKSDGSAYTESMEYALNASIEPGSTFKLASLLAYLEKVQNDEAKKYPMFNHTFRYPLKSGGYRMFEKSDSKVHDETLGSPDEIFQRSSNIGIASMIFDAYGVRNFPAYRKQLERLGIFDTLHTQLGDVMPANIKSGHIDFNTYYGTCFGAGFTMPILRTLIYYNAIANNGKMMAPLFVKYVTDSYDTVYTFEPSVLNEQLLSPVTIQKAQHYLKNVVYGDNGTARHFKDPTCPFAGKTGTRDIWDEEAGAYNRNRNSVSFCGYFPADKPKYSCIIFLYDINGHSNIAVDVFAKIAHSMMNNINYGAMRNVDELPLKSIQHTAPINQKYFNVLMNKIGYDTTNYQASTPYLAATKGGTTTQLKVRGIPNAKKGTVPDVSNKIATDAISELTKAGYKVDIHGHGIVYKQLIDQKKRVATLYLRPPK